MIQYNFFLLQSVKFHSNLKSHSVDVLNMEYNGSCSYFSVCELQFLFLFFISSLSSSFNWRFFLNSPINGQIRRGRCIFSPEIVVVISSLKILSLKQNLLLPKIPCLQILNAFLLDDPGLRENIKIQNRNFKRMLPKD